VVYAAILSSVRNVFPSFIRLIFFALSSTHPSILHTSFYHPHLLSRFIEIPSDNSEVFPLNYLPLKEMKRGAIPL
jgi:hypothetical protein